MLATGPPEKPLSEPSLKVMWSKDSFYLGLDLHGIWHHMSLAMELTAVV